MLVGGFVAGFLDVREEFDDVTDPSRDHITVEICTDQILRDGVRLADPSARGALDWTLTGFREPFVEVFDRRFEVRVSHGRSEALRPQSRFDGYKHPRPQSWGMETTRHFVTTVFVVNEGATLLHEHDKLDLWLPPGGHIDRDELPHEAAKREVQEETGLDVDLLRETPGTKSTLARPLPRPQQLLLEDINVVDDEVGHQHIDFVYYGATSSRELDPAPDEAPVDAWEWFDADDLRDGPANLPEDVIESGLDAIERIGTDETHEF